jgi:Glycosyl hydrolase family 26
MEMTAQLAETRPQRPAETRPKRQAETHARRPLKWHHLAMAVLLAGAAGLFSYNFVPGPSGGPLADVLGPGFFTPIGAGNLLGQGASSSYPAEPAPIVTATANDSTRRHKPGPTHTHPAGGTLFVNAAGLGLYDGQSSPSGIETAASWLGSPGSIKYAQDFVDATSWSTIDNPWNLSNWQGSPFQMVWAVPMLPCGSPDTQCSTNVSDYDLVANGGANGYFQTLAKNLIAAGSGSSYIRLGWEMNAGWMGWAICNVDNSALTSWAGDFVPAFRNIVTSMRSVSGANFKFIWNPINSSNAGCPGANLENFYPGDSYVDMVSLDTYDGIGGDQSDASRWADMRNGVNTGGWTAVKPDAIGGQSFPGYGMDWLAAFGKAHNKEVGLPEWGLQTAGENGGGGDDPYFINQMAAWIKSYASGPCIYWNSGGGTLPLDIPNYTSGGTPNASTAFRSAFTG